MTRREGNTATATTPVTDSRSNVAVLHVSKEGNGATYVHTVETQIKYDILKKTAALGIRALGGAVPLLV